MQIETNTELRRAIQLTPPEVEQHIRLMAALKMFELGKLSAGHAAQLANMSRVAFFETCSQYHISPFNYADEEIPEQLDAEMEIINKL